MKKLLKFFVILIIAMTVLVMCSEAIRKGADDKGDPVQDQATASASEQATPSTEWIYENEEDKMRNQTTYFAFLKSSNTVRFGSPYGASKLNIIIRNKDAENNAIIKVDRGQFLCRVFEDCTISVKFDDGAVKSFKVGEPDDYASDVLFIKDANNFIKQLKSANTVIIEAQFFDHGPAQFEFNAKGLEWQH